MDEGLDGFGGVIQLFPKPDFANTLVITLILSDLNSLLLTLTFVTFILDIRYYWCDNSLTSKGDYKRPTAAAMMSGSLLSVTSRRIRRTSPGLRPTNSRLSPNRSASTCVN
jgi:hypothetical protein